MALPQEIRDQLLYAIKNNKCDSFKIKSVPSSGTGYFCPYQIETVSVQDLFAILDALNDNITVIDFNIEGLPSRPQQNRLACKVINMMKEKVKYNKKLKTSGLYNFEKLNLDTYVIDWKKKPKKTTAPLNYSSVI